MPRSMHLMMHDFFNASAGGAGCYLEWNSFSQKFQSIYLNDLIQEASSEQFAPVEVNGNRVVLLAKPTVRALWCGFYRASLEGAPVLLMPTNKPMEMEILCSKVPENFPNEASLIVFTSGTTGNARPIFHSLESLNVSSSQLLKFGERIDSLYCALNPWSMAGAIFHLFLPLKAKCKLFTVVSSQLLADPEILNFENTEQWMVMSPLRLEFLLDQNSRLSGRILTLTDSLKEKTKTKFRSQCSGELVEGYGMTECAGPVWIEGKTLGSELKLGENGELIVCGDQIALGYAENGKFHCFDGKLNSGDIFTQREGKLLFQSRAKDVIQQAGMKIFPGLLEEALARLDLFKEVIVFPYPIGQQAFPGFLFTSRQSMLNNEQENLISSWIRENLSPEWRPVFWKKVDQIPRTPSGKPDRTAAAYLATLF